MGLTAYYTLSPNRTAAQQIPLIWFCTAVLRHFRLPAERNELLAISHCIPIKEIKC